jgi:hypothetical protein
MRHHAVMHHAMMHHGRMMRSGGSATQQLNRQELARIQGGPMAQQPMGSMQRPMAPPMR